MTESMIHISHRGNIRGPYKELENSWGYINAAIDDGFDVKIDIWRIDKQLFLGHDVPRYPITIEELSRKREWLWIQCKNLEAYEYFDADMKYAFNFFSHNKDDFAVTSHLFHWMHRRIRKTKLNDAIILFPEVYNNIDNITNIVGICSDFVKMNRGDYSAL